MSKYLTLGIAILASLVFLTTAAFGQGQLPPPPSRPVVTQPKPRAPSTKVLRPHLVKVKITQTASVAQDATLTLDILSTVIGQNATQADIEASKPTHYRWWWDGGGWPRNCSRLSGQQQGTWSEWLPLNKYVKPSIVLKGCQTKGCGEFRLQKGVCGVASLNFQVKNSAGESNVKNERSPSIVTESEFCIYGEGLLKRFHGKVKGSLGSSCKVLSKHKSYVQGAEELSLVDLALLDVHYKWTFKDGEAPLLATGATPGIGSKCEYELYTNRVLPEKVSVLEFKTACGATRAQYHPPDAAGCSIVKIPAPGTRDLTTKVRVWTDGLKSESGWALFENKYVKVKAPCNDTSLSSSYYEYMN